MNSDDKLIYLASWGILTSIVYGPCYRKGIKWSVDVLTKDGECFETPFLSNSFDHAIEITYKECLKRGWIS